MTDWFENSEFTGEEGEISADHHFENAHSPELGYTYIEKARASLEAGLENLDEDKHEEAIIYSNISVFRESIKYIEEFGIYLYSRLDSDTQFVEAVTGTRPDKVAGLFEKFQQRDFEGVATEFLDEYDWDSWLSRQLGYDQVEEGGDLEELPTDELEIDEIVDESLQSVRENLHLIADFYIRFKEPYNAIKHGNRVFPMLDAEMKLTASEGDVEINSDRRYVSFLCKTSGSRRGGDRYTFTAPAELLREQAEMVAGLTRDLYTNIYEVRQSKQESKRTGEEVTINTNFYGVSNDSNGKSFQLTSIKNPDSVIWIPQDDIPEDANDFELPQTGKIAIGLHEQSGDIVVRTEGNEIPTHDYPILAEVERDEKSNRLTSFDFTQNFSLSLHQLPLWQYLELRELFESQPFDTITIELSSVGESATEELNGPVDLPNLPELDHPGILEFMRNVERASGEGIPLPLFWSQRVLQTIQFYREKPSLTRDSAKELLRGIEELTEGDVVTLPTISLVESPSDEHAEELDIVERVDLDSIPAGIIFDVDESGHGKFTKVSGRNPQYPLNQEGTRESIAITPIERSPEDAFELFTSEGLDAVEKINPHEEFDESKTVLETKRDSGPRQLWYKFDRYHFIIHRSLPEEYLSEMTVE